MLILQVPTTTLALYTKICVTYNKPSSTDCERALDIRIKQLGPNHVDVASSYNSLGALHKDLGDLQQAKQYYERALDIKIKQLGQDPVDVTCWGFYIKIYFRDSE